MKSNILYIISFICLFSCSSELPKNKKEYLKWINNPKNGLIMIKEINNLTLSVKYMPPEFLAYQEFIYDTKKKKQTGIDSLVSYYEQTHAFIFTIGYKDTQNNNDIMLHEVYSETEFNERVNTLNFKIYDFLSLKTENNKEYSPLLSNLESSYGMGGQRNIYLVFPKNSSNLLDVIFRDQIFDTGISHFKFKTSNLNNVPKIKFWE